MKDASQYPITFGYKAVDNIYYGPNGSVGPYHRGEDRAMPSGTPVIVNGVQIGLSGNTGASSGSHLHIGRFVGGADTAPNGGGFHFTSASVTEVGADGINGNFVRIQGDGASWVYLHLSRQDVKVGQILKGGSMSKDAMTRDELTLLHRLALYGLTPGPSWLDGYTGHSFMDAANSLRGDAPYANNLRIEQDKLMAAVKKIKSDTPHIK